MEFADLQNKSVGELKDVLKDTENKLWQMRVKAHSRELKQVHEFSVLRRTVARIKMLLSRKP